MVGAVQAAGAIPLEVRIDTFIGCCPLRLIWEDGSQALLGRGSSPLIKRFDLTRGKKNHAPASFSAVMSICCSMWKRITRRSWRAR